MSQVSATAQVDLIRRVAVGDEGAIAALYDMYAGPLYGYGLRRLGDTQLAEQLVQDVLTRLWRDAARYDARRGSVRTWVFAIARAVVVDLHRRRPRAIPTDEMPDLDADDAELDELLDAEIVRAALDRLSHEHREVLELGYYAGLPQSAVAARLGLPVGTVKSRTYYALRAFRLACDELGVTP